MTSVGLQVGAIAVLCCTVEIVVPLDQLHELLLNARQLLHGELVLVWSHLLLSQEAKEAQLVLEQEEEGTATTLGATTCPAHSVDVVIGIIGRVELDDPVNLREIKTTLRYISAEEDTLLSLAELKVSRCALLLLLLPVDVLDWNVYVVEQIRVELDSVAT